MLKTVRLHSGIFLDAEFTAPWCIDSAPGDEDIAMLLPNAEQVSIYHLFTHGGCHAKLAGSTESIAIEAGDLLMFPHAHGHLMGSDLHIAPRVVGELVEASNGAGPSRVRHGGGGARTRFACGYMACDRRSCKALLDALPPMLRVSLRDSPASEWIEGAIRHASSQSHAPIPGGDVVLARLAELLFVESLREYVRTLPDSERGWLAGLRDPHVGRALALLHGEPARDWHVESLARETGLSRSALAERFVSLLGEPPMQYLTAWRMNLAARALSTTSNAVGRIAEQVGYESEAAFNRAFKKEFGMPPAAWRRASR
jgi:AraC-like DNA-binding protein